VKLSFEENELGWLWNHWAPWLQHQLTSCWNGNLSTC